MMVTIQNVRNWMIVVTVAVAAAALVAPERAVAVAGCPPNEDFCVETPAAWAGQCWGSYCYSEREFCCIQIE